MSPSMPAPPISVVDVVAVDEGRHARRSWWRQPSRVASQEALVRVRAVEIEAAPVVVDEQEARVRLGVVLDAELDEHVVLDRHRAATRNWMIPSSPNCEKTWNSASRERASGGSARDPRRLGARRSAAAGARARAAASRAARAPAEPRRRSACTRSITPIATSAPARTRRGSRARRARSRPPCSARARSRPAATRRSRSASAPRPRAPRRRPRPGRAAATSSAASPDLLARARARRPRRPGSRAPSPRAAAGSRARSRLR